MELSWLHLDAENAFMSYFFLSTLVQFTFWMSGYTYWPLVLLFLHNRELRSTGGC
jgi:hypothetical protein